MNELLKLIKDFLNQLIGGKSDGGTSQEEEGAAGSGGGGTQTNRGQAASNTEVESVEQAQIEAQNRVAESAEEAADGFERVAQSTNDFDSSLNGVEAGLSAFGVQADGFFNNIRGVKDGFGQLKTDLKGLKGLGGLGGGKGGLSKLPGLGGLGDQLKKMGGGLANKLMSGLSIAGPYGQMAATAINVAKNFKGIAKGIGKVFGFGRKSLEEKLSKKSDEEVREFLREKREKKEAFTGPLGSKFGFGGGKLDKEIRTAEKELEARRKHQEEVGERVFSTSVTLTEETGRSMAANLSSILSELQNGHLRDIADNTAIIAGKKKLSSGSENAETQAQVQTDSQGG